MGLGFLLGLMSGILVARIFDLFNDWYVWHTYKDNIDWDANDE